MKIYKRNPLDIDLGGAEALILPAIAIIVVLLLGIWALGGANGTAISARLIQNPLTLTGNDSTLLQVQLSNPTAQMAQNVTVQVTAPSAPHLSITPVRQTIPFLGSGETRTLEFLVIPIDMPSDPFTPGNYVIKVTTQLNGKPYETQVNAQIIK